MHTSNYTTTIAYAELNTYFEHPWKEEKFKQRNVAQRNSMLPENYGKEFDLNAIRHALEEIQET